MDKNNKILVGKIVAPQGLCGDVRIVSFANKPEDFKKFIIYSDKFTPEQFHFIRVIKSNMIIAHIDSVASRNEAELIRGLELFIDRSNLPPSLCASEFYQSDLIGFTVIQDGKQIGIIDGFQNFGAGDIIELTNGNMVSFIGADVNLETKIVVVR